MLVVMWWRARKLIRVDRVEAGISVGDLAVNSKVNPPLYL